MKRFTVGAVEQRIRDAEDKMLAHVEAEVVAPVYVLVGAYCTKYGRRFGTHNGYFFYVLVDGRVDSYAAGRGDYYDGYDDGFKYARGERVALRSLQKLLDISVTPTTDVGDLLPNYPEEDEDADT